MFFQIFQHLLIISLSVLSIKNYHLSFSLTSELFTEESILSFLEGASFSGLGVNWI